MFQISIENYLGSVLKGEKPSSSIDELAKTIENIGGYMIKQSEQIEERLRRAASRLGEMEEDFEQIIEAIALAEPAAPAAPTAPAPSAPSAPAVGMPSAPSVGSTPSMPSAPSIGGAPGAADLQSALSGLKAPDVGSSSGPGPSMGGPVSQMQELKNAFSGGGDQSHLAAAPPRRDKSSGGGGGGPMSQMQELKNAFSGGGDQSHLPAAPPRRDTEESAAPQSMQSEIMGVLSRRRDRKEEEAEVDAEEEETGIYKSPVRGLSQQPAYKSILKPVGSEYEEVDEVESATVSTTKPGRPAAKKAKKGDRPVKKKMAGTTTNIAELAAKRFSQLLSGKKISPDEELGAEEKKVIKDKTEKMEVIQKKVAEVKNAFSAAFTKGMEAQKGTPPKKPTEEAVIETEPEVKEEKIKVELKPPKKEPVKKPAEKKTKAKKSGSKVDLQSRLKGAFSEKKK
ncbi:MAG: hypothetical protein ACTSYA_09800 [Candidatus Kariarchaeaceae archaeon]